MTNIKCKKCGFNDICSFKDKIDESHTCMFLVSKEWLEKNKDII